MNSGKASQLLYKAKSAFSGPEVERIRQALAFSLNGSGQDCFQPTRVANLLIDHKADADTIISCLLSQEVWSGGKDPAQFEASFGRAVVRTLKNLPQPFAIRTDSCDHRRQDINELLTSFATDTREAVLLLFFRLDSLEHTNVQSNQELRKLAQETLDLYVPLAGRLGFNNVRVQLEDASFSILDPDTYQKLNSKIAHIRVEDGKCLDIILKGVQHYLKQKGIEGQIQGRTKGIYSIYKKISRQQASLDQIMDRIGARIIVPTVSECYLTLGLLHTHFSPIPGTFDDYIRLPKDNGYQSLHTCIYPLRDISSKPIEFQIRTYLMHMEAEFGLAAHWRYKQHSDTQDMTEKRQSRWIQSLVHQHKNSKSSEDFIQALHRQVFENHIVIFSNGGQIDRLPDKSTVGDYLQRHNINPLDRLTIKVNSQPTGLDRILEDGDSIEIVPESQSAFANR